MIRGGILVLALCAVLGTAGNAAAFTTIGAADPGAGTIDYLECIPVACPGAAVLDSVAGTPVTAPDGVITRVLAQVEGSFTVLVQRPTVRIPSHLTSTEAVASQAIAGQGRGPGIVTDAAVRLPVKAGDMVGVSLAGGVKIATLPDAESLAWLTPFYHGPIDVGAGFRETQAVLLQARIEPDIDRDGFGDETQDACPTNGAAAGPCPVLTSALGRLAVTRTAGARSGKAGVLLTNPNAVPVSGKLALKLGKPKAGSAKYKIAAGSAKTVNVKLSPSALALLKAKGRVRLTFSATARGARGATFTAKGSLTANNPAKKKKQTSGSGTYRKAPDSGPSLRFEVTSRGRKIADLEGTIYGACYFPTSPTTGSFKLHKLYPVVNSIAVTAKGSFSGVLESDGFKTTIVGGKLSKGVATGRVFVAGKGCFGSGNFKSIRTGS